jgi:N-carbamoylputrescine amidase
MFNECARRYGRRGGHVILVPRAVGRASLGRWLVAMRMAAIVSGAYVLSSNRQGLDSKGQLFGGSGWIIDPDGNLVAETSPALPVVFHEIDTDLVLRAQREYPCYVREGVSMPNIELRNRLSKFNVQRSNFHRSTVGVLS